jgi:prophage tail gpP-like protein
MTVNTKIEINGVEVTDIRSISATKLLNGKIDDINYSGKDNNELLTISGRDFGSILQDIIVSPRIFKDTEVSEIVTAIMSQNISQITTNNVNTTTTTLDKITFTNISVYDALHQLAELAGFYFYVDTDKDLHFEEKESISSGITLDNTNTVSAKFTTSEQDQYTKVTVQGDRQLTAAEQIMTTGTDNTGSTYILDDKPYSVGVVLSGASNTTLSPGGVFNISDPAEENVKYLVDFQNRSVILTSGTTAGDNIQATGSVVIFNYNRSTPVISIKEVPANYPKHKIITDRNIKDINEAADKAQTFLDEHKNPKTEEIVEIDGIVDVTPGNTTIVNLPNHNQNNVTYAITNALYEFNPTNIRSDRVLTVRLNKKISNFIDIMKEQVLRLRALESSETDSSITSVETETNPIGVANTTEVISRSIGSAFYFHTPGHDQLNSPTALLGDVRVGSTVFQNGIKI